MIGVNLELLTEHEDVFFYKWPLYDIGVSMQPFEALCDVMTMFESLMLEKGAAGRVLARLIDQGTKAGVAIQLHIADLDAAVEGLPEKHKLKTSVFSLERAGPICTGAVPGIEYSRQKLRRLFGLS